MVVLYQRNENEADYQIMHEKQSGSHNLWMQIKARLTWQKYLLGARLTKNYDKLRKKLMVNLEFLLRFFFINRAPDLLLQTMLQETQLLKLKPVKLPRVWLVTRPDQNCWSGDPLTRRSCSTPGAGSLNSRTHMSPASYCWIYPQSGLA